MARIERKLGVNCECIRGMSAVDTLPLIREVGFEAVFAGAHRRRDVAAIKEACDKLGIFLNSLHAPFSGINNLWLPGMNYLPLYKNILESIDAASENGIPAVVLHVSSGWYAPELSDVGFARYDHLVEYALDRNVQIAFENLRMVGNLAYLADRYRKMPNVGYCLDMGHEHCYTPTVTWMDIFRSRLLLTHIHDNLGIREENEEHTDVHYLPFDGDVDYASFMRHLDQYGYEGNLTLEVSNGTKPEYGEMKPIEFLQTAYDRVARIAKM